MQHEIRLLHFGFDRGQRPKLSTDGGYNWRFEEKTCTLMPSLRLCAVTREIASSDTFNNVTINKNSNNSGTGSFRLIL